MLAGRAAVLVLAIVSVAGVGPAAAQSSAARPQGVVELLEHAARFGGREGRAGGNGANNGVRILFDDPGPRDADLAALRPLLAKSPAPIALDLAGCDLLTDAGLAHLADLKSLAGLQLGGKGITDAGLRHLTGLPNLHDLSLSGDAFTDAGLAPIGKLTSLKRFAAYSRNVTHAGYAHLSALVNLEAVHVGGNFDLGDEPLSHMTGMTKLAELSVGGAKFTDVGMAHLASHVELKKLRMDADDVTPTGVARLASLKKLESLTVLSGPAFGGEALAVLAGLPELRELHLIYTARLQRSGARQIGKLTKLKDLHIGFVENGVLEEIVGLGELESLFLVYSRVDDDDLRAVSRLPALKKLFLSNTNVTDDGIKHLEGMPNLQLLTADETGLTDAALASIATMPQFETLQAHECKITGSGFKHLQKLTKLTELKLQGNPVTDASLSALREIASLKKLRLHGTKTSEAAALALKQARPEMQIFDVTGTELYLNAARIVRSPPPPRGEIAVQRPDLVFTAEEFHKGYKADEEAFVAKLQGKLVELTGEVGYVGHDSLVYFRVGENPMAAAGEMIDPRPWTKVVPGQKIRIQGRRSPYAGGPVIMKCVFVETGPYGAVQVAAAEWAKEFAADREAAEKKYKDKYVVVTGEVTSKEYDSHGGVSIGLKTGGKLQVVCTASSLYNQWAKQVRVGQTLQLFGEFLAVNYDKDVALRMCRPMTELPSE